MREEREFDGSGIVQFRRGLRISVRRGAPLLRFTGESGELVFGGAGGFLLWLDIDGAGRRGRAEVPYPGPNVVEYPSPLYTIEDAIHSREHCTEARVSGRLARQAMEIEIALRESHRHGNVRIELPLRDRSLAMRYASFR